MLWAHTHDYQIRHFPFIELQNVVSVDVVSVIAVVVVVVVVDDLS